MNFNQNKGSNTDLTETSKSGSKRLRWLPGLIIFLLAFFALFGENIINLTQSTIQIVGNSEQREVNRCARELEKERIKNNDRAGIPKAECALKIGKELYNTDPQKAIQLCIDNYPPGLASKSIMTLVCEGELRRP